MFKNFFVTALLFLVPLLVFGKVKAPDRLYIAPKYDINVYAYDEDADVFTIEVTEEPDVGPRRVTPEVLHRGVAMSLDFKTFSRKKKEYVGSSFVTQESMPLLFENEVQARKKTKPKKK